jgi:biopolymer transport protein ExbD
VKKKVDLKNLREIIKHGLNDDQRDFVRAKTDKDVNVRQLESVMNEVMLPRVKNFSMATEMRMHHERFRESKTSYWTLD